MLRVKDLPRVLEVYVHVVVDDEEPGKLLQVLRRHHQGIPRLAAELPAVIVPANLRRDDGRSMAGPADVLQS